MIWTQRQHEYRELLLLNIVKIAGLSNKRPFSDTALKPHWKTYKHINL